MKRLVVGTLSALALSALAAPAFASEDSAVNLKANSSPLVETDPFSLVSLGYQGYFSAEGIPSNGRFAQQVRAGRIDATDLVEVAIARGRLSADRLDDRSYLSAVESHLNHLDRGGN